MYFRIPILILFIVVCLAGFVVLKGNFDSPASANGHPLETPNSNEKSTPRNIDLSTGGNAINTITARDLRAHVDFLSDDLLKGRDTNSHGLKVAAQYIATHFEKNGLQPVGENGTYFQPVYLTESKVLPSSGFAVEVDGEMIPLKYKKDFLVTSFPQQSGKIVSSEMVFAGFGIKADEYNYNDYSDISVSGKFSVFVTGEPEAENDSSFFNGALRTRYSNGSTKREIAREMGVAGTINILRKEHMRIFSWDRLQDILGKAEIDLASPEKVLANDLPGVMLHPDAANLIFANTSKSYIEIDQNAENGSAESFNLDKKVKISVHFESENFTDNNVVGYLEGADPKLKSEVIVVGGHYDHIGVGTAVEGDSIYNGAADNASGVASILELVEAFASLPEAPRRSILFIAYTAEEKGLLGSEHYVNNPIFPLSKTIANFNIDMIGIGDSTAIVLIGQELSSLGQILAEASEQVGLTVQPDDMPEQRIFYRSDHYNFAKKGIPAIFPSFAMKRPDFPEFRNFYHRPQDEITWNWFNFKTMEKQIQAVFLAVLSVANSENVPEWETGVEFAKFREIDD